MIIKPSECIKEFERLKKPAYRKKRAVTTGFAFMDQTIKLALGYLMVVSGYPSSGKSEFVDALLQNCAILHGWRSLIFSPENFPTEEHMCKIAERHLGKCMIDFDDQDTKDALAFLDDHFRWMYPEEPSLDNLMALAEQEHKIRPIHALVLDPWNNVVHNRREELVSEYLSAALSRLIRFGRMNKILIIIVAHPKNPPPQKDPKKPIPHANVWDIDGGAMWRNKSDYVVICHRPCMATHSMEAYFQKIKYKWMGEIGKHTLDYEYLTGRYKETCMLPKEEKIFPYPIKAGTIKPPF